MTLAPLNGFFPADYPAGQSFAAAIGEGSPDMQSIEVEIGDARELQRGATSEADFFAEHGFVLLPHQTAARDWDRDVVEVYLPELGTVIRERLFPGRRVEFQLFPNILRRGRDTPTPFYAEGVHSDGGRDADDYVHNIAAFAGDQAANWWRARYEREDVERLVWVDFWRLTNMTAPLEHMPLALCDTGTLAAEDLVPTEFTGIAPEGRPTRHLSLRHNPGQRWYYYPRMTGEEMLAFKLGEFAKEPGPPRNCFHTAFRDPASSLGAEERQSCEYRVGVLILRD